MKRFIYAFSVLFTLMTGLSSCTFFNSSEDHLDIVIPAIEAAIIEQSDSFMVMEGFELIESNTVSNPDMKVLGKPVSEAKDHYYEFKTKLRVIRDCNKDIPFPPSEKDNKRYLFYNLDCVGPTSVPGISKSTYELLFEGDVFEATCSFKYRELNEHNPFDIVRMEDTDPPRTVDGPGRLKYDGPTIIEVNYRGERSDPRAEALEAKEF